MRITSNDNLEGVDQHGYNLGWRQLISDYRLGVKLRNTIYHKDDDRLLDDTVTVASIDFGWEQWRKNRHRIELNFHYEYDFDISDNNIRLEFTYHQSAGRDYIDNTPEEILFRQLRKTRIPADPNNVIY